MSTELTMLVLSAVLCVVMSLPYTAALPPTVAAGNRDNLPPPVGWAARGKRAHANMIENLAPFAALVLAAVVAQKTGSLTALGAQLFFYARLAYAVIYYAGIPWLRTLAWIVSVIGMALIVVAFFR